MDLIALRDWFLRDRRPLPWRHHPSPYAVWISEVMLQQTQVEVVKRYFSSWMRQFPTVHALSQAPIQQVLKAWEGLGYYSRARYLHEAAQFLVAHHGGELPADREALKEVKGLGPYTIGAILSFAFHKRAAAVDGNVIRVLSRYFLIEEEVSKPSVHKKMWKMAEELLPEEEPWLIVEALIELGALICRKTPLCASCPLQTGCQAAQAEKAHLLPKKACRRKVTHLKRFVAVVEAEGHFLMHQERAGQVMAGLYEFPYVETEDFSVFEAYVTKWLGGASVFQCHLPEVEHSFTRFRVRLFPSLWHLEKRQGVPGHRWLSREELQKSACSSGHRRIARELYRES